MLEPEVQVIDAVVSIYHKGDDPVAQDWWRIKTALAELGKSPNTAMRKLLCEIKIGLSNHCRYDAAWRDSVTEDINAVLEQQ